MLHDENRVLPVSSLLKNYKGDIDDVCLTVPSIVNRTGVRDGARRADERRGARGAAEQRGHDQGCDPVVGILKH